MANRNGRIKQLCRMGSWILLLGCAALGYSADLPQPANEAYGEDAAAADHFDAEPELEARRQESYALWMLRSLGPAGLLLLVVAGGLSFIVTMLITLRGNGPFAAAALVLIVPIPFLLGIFGFFQGAIASFQVIASSSVAPKPHELADGVASALFNPLVGLMLTAPSFAVATLGSLIRSWTHPSPSVRERSPD